MCGRNNFKSHIHGSSRANSSPPGLDVSYKNYPAAVSDDNMESEPLPADHQNQSLSENMVSDSDILNIVCR
jgi:hypothetical protein